MAEFFEPAHETGVFQEIKGFSVDEDLQEIGICPSRESGFEKSVDFQNRICVEILLFVCHGHKVQKGSAPTQHAEEGIQGSAGIGEGVKPFRKAEPKSPGLGSKGLENSGFHTGFPGALAAIIHPVAQVFTVILTGMEETPDALEAAIQIP
jgi:hypothetical protein